MVKKPKKESKFYTYIKHAVEGEGGHYHKIADTFPSPGPDGKRFIPKKPYDNLFVWQGNSAYIEVKYKKDLSAFSTKNLSDHQNENLQKIHENSADNIYALVVLGIYRPREIKRIYIFDYSWLKTHPLRKADLLKIEKYIDIKKDTFAMNSFFKNIIGWEEN